MYAGHSRDPGRERMRRRGEAGRTWEPGTEWNAVRALLAHEAVTEMGRERATTAEPLTDLAGVLAAIDLTRQARVALSTVGSLPLEVFTDRSVTLRHGRYVLPVRAEARGRVRGIVHDRSQSGQTLFIEPEHVVDANNDLVQATREEEHETGRILGELTDAVRARLDDIQ